MHVQVARTTATLSVTQASQSICDWLNCVITFLQQPKAVEIAGTFSADQTSKLRVCPAHGR